MWPFKKKQPQKEPESKLFETVLCIPGNWVDRDEFIRLIVSSSNGEYIAAGFILMHAKTKKHYTIDFCERDEKMRTSFQYAGMPTGITDAFLDEIGQHKHVIYISGPTGNLIDAEHIAFAGAAILNAGGIGIKIETAGKAFEKSQWLGVIKVFEPGYLYQMFVVDTIVTADGAVHSCGMANLGYKDTIVSGEEFQEAVALISLFGVYQLVDKPTIINGQTFSTSIESPTFRITDEPDQPYKEQELFRNPFGMWRLTKL